MECLDCRMLEDCRRLGMLGQMAAVDKGGDVELEARTSRTEVRQVVEAAKAVGCKRVDSLEEMLDSFPDIDIGTSFDFWEGELG